MIKWKVFKSTLNTLHVVSMDLVDFVLEYLTKTYHLLKQPFYTHPNNGQNGENQTENGTKLK